MERETMNGRPLGHGMVVVDVLIKEEIQRNKLENVPIALQAEDGQ